LAVGTDTVYVTLTNNGGTALGGNNTTVVKFTITVLLDDQINETTATNDLEVYPNPAKDYIHIVIPDNSVKTLTIIDVTGRIVLEEAVTSDQLIVNVSDLPSGIYIIIAKGDDKVFKSRITIK
jgi:hypothetical protein